MKVDKFIGEREKGASERKNTQVNRQTDIYKSERELEETEIKNSEGREVQTKERGGEREKEQTGIQSDRHS